MMRLSLTYRGPRTKQDARKRLETTARLCRELGKSKPRIRIQAKGVKR